MLAISTTIFLRMAAANASKLSATIMKCPGAADHVVAAILIEVGFDREDRQAR